MLSVNKFGRPAAPSLKSGYRENSISNKYSEPINIHIVAAIPPTEIRKIHTAGGSFWEAGGTDVSVSATSAAADPVSSGGFSSSALSTGKSAAEGTRDSGGFAGSEGGVGSGGNSIRSSSTF